MGRRTGVLSHPQVARVLAAYVLARIPAAAVWLSVVLDVSRASGSYALAGSAVGAYGVGVAVFAPLIGRTADRIGAWRVLLLCALAQLPALLLLASVAGDGGVALLAPALVAGAVQPPLVPCMRAGWAQLVPDERDREACFAFDSVLGEVVDLAAPLIAVGLDVTRGDRGSLQLVACAVAATTVLFVAVAPAPPSRQERPVRAPLRPVLPVLAVIVTLTAAFGAVEVGIVALADGAGERSIAGLLLAAFTGGSIVGGIAYARSRRRRPPAGLLLLLLLLPLGYGLLGAALLPGSPLLLVPLVALAGFAVAPAVTVLLGLLQAVAVEGAVTETFTYGTTANFIGVAVGSTVAGWCGDHAGLLPGTTAGQAGLVVAVLLVVGTGLVVAGVSSRLPEPQELEEPEAVAEAAAAALPGSAPTGVAALAGPPLPGPRHVRFAGEAQAA